MSKRLVQFLGEHGKRVELSELILFRVIMFFLKASVSQAIIDGGKKMDCPVHFVSVTSVFGMPG